MRIINMKIGDRVKIVGTKSTPFLLEEVYGSTGKIIKYGKAFDYVVKLDKPVQTEKGILFDFPVFESEIAEG